jgi:SAM-dependent methyltransferase
VPGATWRQADAMALPFEDAQFDLIACQFGIMFFPDKPAAFAEARRVLTPEGLLFVSAWDTIDTHDFQAAIIAGLNRAFPDDPPTFMISVPHGYSDVDVIVSDLRAGGFDSVPIESVTLEGHAASVADLAAGYCVGTPLRPAIEARGDLTTVIAIIATEVDAQLGAGPVSGSMTAHVIEASHRSGHTSTSS